MNKLLFLILLIGVIACSPFITIWSLNTIFTTNIPQNFETWAAMVWLTVITFGRISMKTNE